HLVVPPLYLLSPPPPPHIYTPPLHDALPISYWRNKSQWSASGATAGRLTEMFWPTKRLGERRSPSPLSEQTSGTASAFPQASLSDRKSTRLNSSHVEISYAVFCLKKKKYEKN